MDIKLVHEEFIFFYSHRKLSIRVFLTYRIVLQFQGLQDLHGGMMLVQIPLLIKLGLKSEVEVFFLCFCLV